MAALVFFFGDALVRVGTTSGIRSYISMVSVFRIWDLYITTSIESIAAPGRLFSIFNISLRALDVLFIALYAILRDSIRQSYWNACIYSRIRLAREKALISGKKYFFDLEPKKEEVLIIN